MARINRARMATEITKLEGGKVNLSVAQVAEVLRLTLAVVGGIVEASGEVMDVWDMATPAYRKCKAPLRRQIDAAAKRLCNPPKRRKARKKCLIEES